MQKRIKHVNENEGEETTCGHARHRDQYGRGDRRLLGAEQRSEYTAWRYGKHRLAHRGHSQAGQVLVTRATVEELGDEFR